MTAQAPGKKFEIVVCDNREALNVRAAELWVTTVATAIRECGRACVALSGGSTPKALYELLATPVWAGRVDWVRLHLFWGDERAVPADNPESNYRMVRNALMSKAAIPEANIHRVKAELGAAQAAAAYEQEMRQFFANEPMPRFDLVLLGLGENGHTASLFPHTQMLHEQRRWMAAEYIDEVKMERISLTAPAINHGRTIAFLVSGAGKAAVVDEIMYGPRDPERLPAQMVHADDGKLMWLLDRDAAAQIAKRP